MVLDSVSKKPLEYATVGIAEMQLNGLTNNEGLWKVDSLPAGFYTIQCSFVGYHPYKNKIWIDRSTLMQIDLCAEDHHLHEVVVEGHTDEMHNMAVQTRVTLEAVQLERTRGLTIADQLKQLSGVSLLNTGPTITKPVIRGLHSNRLVTVQNDIRQEGQQWGADHGAEIDPFSPAKIEVIKGAASVEYGAEAIAGVVKISPREFRTNNGIGGELLMMGASNNGLGASSLLLEGAHFSKHKLSWRVQGTLRKAGDSRTPDYVMSNTGFEEANGSYALHYQFKHFHAEFSQSVFNTTLGVLRASHVGNTSDLMHAIQSGMPTYTAPFTYNIDKPRQEVKHVTYALKLFYQFNNGAKAQVILSKQGNERKEFDRPPRWVNAAQAEMPAYYLTLNTHIAEAKYEHQKWNNFKGHWGVMYLHQGNYSEGLQPIIPNFIADNIGVYAIEKWSRGRWVAEAGARFDARYQTKYALSNNVVNEDKKQFSNTTFALGASYYMSSKVKVQSNVSSAWRPPSINELYSYGLHGGTASFEIGDANLKSERSYNAEVLFEYKHQDHLIELSFYRNEINNFIYKEPIPYPTITIRGAFPQFKYVQHHALLQGIDLNMRKSVYRWFYVGLNASYLHAQNLESNQPLILMPANRVRATLGFEKATVGKLKNVFGNVQTTYVAKQNRFVAGLDYVDPPAAYALVDVSVGFEMLVKNQPLRWSVSGYNVFNTAYRDYLSRFRYYALDPGRNIVLRLAVPLSIIKTKKYHEH